jgi:hypothetical protein
VKVKGMVDGSTVAADKVRIKKTETADHHEHEGTGALALPPLQPAHEQHDGVNGSVVSVNGSTDPAACGSGDTGSFTVTDHDGNTFTVNVSPTTTFGHGHGHDDGDDDDQASAPAQSFADVCVGTKVGAKGAVTDTTVAADMVFVRGDHKGDHEGDHEGDDAAENHDTASAEHDGEGHPAATSGQDSGGDHHDGSSHDGSGDQASSDHGSGHDD